MRGGTRLCSEETSGVGFSAWYSGCCRKWQFHFPGYTTEIEVNYFHYADCTFIDWRARRVHDSHSLTLPLS